MKVTKVAGLARAEVAECSRSSDFDQNAKKAMAV
jgi:hypothetical protein